MILSVLIAFFTKLNDLLEQNEKKPKRPDYVTKQELFRWLDEYFSKKFAVKSSDRNMGDADKQNTETNKKETKKQGYAIDNDFKDIFNFKL
jgi:hypothetical protein